MRKFVTIAFSLTLLAFIVAATIGPQISTGARCSSGVDCEIGSSKITSLTLLTDVDVRIKNSSSGNVTLDFRDYADTTDDDMAHAILTTNCTTTTTGAEDCDFTIGVVEAGAAADTRFNINADGGIAIGSANMDAITLVTATGTVTVDGFVRGNKPLRQLSSGTLTANTVNLATAAGTYTLPDTCDAVTGSWVTVVVQDASEVVIIAVSSGDQLHPIGLSIDQDHVIDSAGGASGDGDFITFVCLALNSWYTTSFGGVWVDGGAS